MVSDCWRRRHCRYYGNFESRRKTALMLIRLRLLSVTDTPHIHYPNPLSLKGRG